MFGQAQVSSEYTFTQSASYTSVNAAKALSNYFGNKTVAQSGQNKSSAGTSAAKNDSNTNLIDDDNENQQNNDLILDKNKDDKNDASLIYAKSSDATPTTIVELEAAMGATNKSITKEQLMAYLKSLSNSGKASAASITVVKNLIAQFDDLSDSSGHLTSLGTKDAQDYKTVTTDQVTSPVDIRI